MKRQDTKEFISKAPSPSPSPSRGEGNNTAPPLRGGDEGEGDVCGFTNDFISNKGVTLIELLVVITVIGVLLAALGFEFAGWSSGYKIESQVRGLHADLLEARVRAMEEKRRRGIAMATNRYQVFIVNDDGSWVTDIPRWQDAKRLGYSIYGGNTLVMSSRGIVTPDAVIWFTTKGSAPDYDCIAVSSTRINLGKRNDPNSAWSTCNVK